MRAFVSGSARFLALTALFLMGAAGARAQDVTEPALKAAFIFNFAKFTEWPSDALSSTGAFSMCVLGDPAVADALERTVRGRSHNGRRIDVTRVATDGPLGTCHVLYISGVSPNDSTKVLTTVGSAPVLTMSDLDTFNRLGGIAQFFFENGRLRFSVRLESVKRARLQMSSKLLALARQQ